MTAAKEPKAPLEVTETCRCGAALTVKGLTWTATRDAVAEWRLVHRCLAGPGGFALPDPMMEGRL